MEGIKNILHDDNFKSAELELQPYIDNLSKKKGKFYNECERTKSLALFLFWLETTKGVLYGRKEVGNI